MVEYKRYPAVSCDEKLSQELLLGKLGYDIGLMHSG